MRKKVWIAGAGNVGAGEIAERMIGIVQALAQLSTPERMARRRRRIGV